MQDFRNQLYSHYISNFKNMSVERYEEIYSSQKIYFDHKYLPFLRDLKPEDKILELGCGSGFMLNYLGNMGFENVIGIDISQEQVSIASHFGQNAIASDVFDYLSDQEDKFDAVLALDFIEHFSKNELILLFTQIFKSLRSNGKLIIQTPNGEGLFSGQVIFGDLTHLTIFTPASLQQLLIECGFINFQFHDTGPVPKDFINYLRLIFWHFITYIANFIRKIEANKTQSIWTENFICTCQKKSA